MTIISAPSRDLSQPCWLKTLAEKLMPLEKPPEEEHPHSDVENANRFGWVSSFSRLLRIENKYIKTSEIDEESLLKAQEIFHLYIQSMISLGFDVNKDLVWQDSKPLHKAAERGGKIVAACLIKLGAEVDGYSNFDKTPLYEAAARSQAEIVKLLIDKGADVTKSNHRRFGWNELALHVATSPDVIDLLISGGTPVNAICGEAFKFTALHWTAHCARPDAVEALLRHGIVDVEDRFGHTALDVAKKVQDGTYSMMMYGADPLDAEVVKKRFDRTVELLEQHHKTISEVV